MRKNYILLIEDNPDDTLLIQRAYKQAGFPHELVSVADGDAALALLMGPEAQHTLPPALVLLDLRLPGIDGAHVLKRLREDARMKSVPIVILSSSQEEKDVAGSYALGANSYLRKPVDFLQFHDMLSMVWRYWLGTNVTLDTILP